MMPPRAANNAELIKIPNFFHLTPSHIEKHCKALKGGSYITTVIIS
jgi:small subunit ribosomal protein S35